MSAGIDAGSGFTAGAVVVALGEEGAEVLGLVDPVVPAAAVRLCVCELPPRASVAAPLVQAPSSSPALRAAATAAVGDGIPPVSPGIEESPSGEGGRGLEDDPGLQLRRQLE